MQNTLLIPIQESIKNFNFDNWGLAKLERPFSFDRYTDWLASGQHGEMTYLERHKSFKENPRAWMPEARTALVVTKSYLNLPGKEKTPNLNIARYARGEDYHDWLAKDLSALGENLKIAIPELEYRTFTDSSPVLERDLAFRAGLGWIGKNTCLIHPAQGSFFFIGGLYTNLVFDGPANPIHDFCGTCTRCIDACPTKAISENKSLDARLCISYWTIEAKKPAPDELRKHFSDHFFGCDICQDVCPWNKKPLLQSLSEQKPLETNRKSDLEFFLEATDMAIADRVKGTALERAKPSGLRRNAKIVLENSTQDLSSFKD
jgi:epoxyqueuosine reductase